MKFSMKSKLVSAVAATGLVLSSTPAHAVDLAGSGATFVAPILDVRFYASELRAEPVRDWLKQLAATDRWRIGEDIKTVQFGWPLGMPVVRNLGGGLR